MIFSQGLAQRASNSPPNHANTYEVGNTYFPFLPLGSALSYFVFLEKVETLKPFLIAETIEIGNERQRKKITGWSTKEETSGGQGIIANWCRLINVVSCCRH
jgi:hypothetical protein